MTEQDPNIVPERRTSDPADFTSAIKSSFRLGRWYRKALVHHALYVPRGRFWLDISFGFRPRMTRYGKPVYTQEMLADYEFYCKHREDIPAAVREGRIFA